MKYNIKIINAFTNRVNHGNPAGFLYTDEQLEPKLMQQIAKKMGLSETAFIHPSNQQSIDYRVHFYTPNKRIESCGHATVASFGYLSEQKNLPETISIENDLGVSQIYFEKNKTYLAHHQFNSQKLNQSDSDLIEEQVGEKIKPLIMSTGVNFVGFELKTKKLAELSLNQDLIYSISERNNLVGFYIFAQMNNQIFTRMFAPYYGIEEESATGMAAAPLYYVLKNQNRVSNAEIIIYQGYFMNPIRESQIHCFEKNDNLLVGGDWVVAGEKIMNQNAL